MTPQRFCDLARRLMQHPAVPYQEHPVREEAEKICAEHDLVAERDVFARRDERRHL